MIGTFADEHRLVTSALETCSVAVAATARGRWNVTLFEGAALPTRVSVDDGWLLFDSGPVELPSQVTQPYWPLLALNRALPPLAKYCSRDGRTWHVAAQAPVDDDVSLTHVVRDTATAVGHGLAWLCDLPLPTPQAGASDAPAIVETLCNDSGWSFRMRDSATALVALEAGSEFQQAAVTIEPSLGIVAAVPLLPGVETAALSPLCCDALGVFLLRVCSALRMVRVAADRQEPLARLEVALGPTTTAETLAHALAALSLAFRITNREAMVLSSNEPIARRFLSQCGLPPATQTEGVRLGPLSRPGEGQGEGDEIHRFSDDTRSQPTIDPPHPVLLPSGRRNPQVATGIFACGEDWRR